MERKTRKIKSDIDLTRKKAKEFDLNMNIKVAYKTGKVIYGRNQILRMLRQNPFKMLIVSKNCPKELENQLNYFNSLLKEKDQIFVYKYKGSSWDLGLAMAKPYWVSIIGIIDYGDSELKQLQQVKRQ